MICDSDEQYLVILVAKNLSLTMYFSETVNIFFNLVKYFVFT